LKPPTSPAAVQEKWKTIPCQSKEKPVYCYVDEGGALSKRKKRVGKPGRRDPCEEFGHGGVKKKRTPAVEYAEDEEEWEDEDDEVVVLSDEAEAEEDDEEEGILFDKHTVVRVFFVYVTVFVTM
jgi:hypothetical protein